MFPATLLELLSPPILVGLFTVLVLENIPWFVNLTPNEKFGWNALFNLIAGFIVGAIEAFVSPEHFGVAAEGYAALVPLLNLIFANFATTFITTQGAYMGGKRAFSDYFASSTVKIAKLESARTRKTEFARLKKAA